MTPLQKNVELQRRAQWNQTGLASELVVMSQIMPTGPSPESRYTMSADKNVYC